MKLIDSHCHFHLPPFSKNYEKNWQIAQKAGIETLIIPGITENDFPIFMDLAKKFPEFYFAVGLHPCFFHSPDSLFQLAEFLQNNAIKICAIGEVGLDKFAKTPFDKQIDLLKAQISLANTFSLPMIFHSRKTHAELLALLKANPVKEKGVIHGFSGSFEEAMQFIKFGFLIGINGVITYDRAQKTRQTVSNLPLDFIVLETDSPSAPIFGKQGAPNHPKYLVEIFNSFCELRKESPNLLLNSINKTVKDFFLS